MERKALLALLALVAQNSLLVTTMRYSRTRAVAQMYLPTTAVIVDECMKMLVCIAAIAWQWRASRNASPKDATEGGRAPRSLFKHFQHEVCERPREVLKMAGVAALYTHRTTFPASCSASMLQCPPVQTHLHVRSARCACAGCRRRLAGKDGPDELDDGLRDLFASALSRARELRGLREAPEFFRGTRAWRVIGEVEIPGHRMKKEKTNSRMR